MKGTKCEEKQTWRHEEYHKEKKTLMGVSGERKSCTTLPYLTLDFVL